jgi:hypothetical protein
MFIEPIALPFRNCSLSYSSRVGAARVILALWQADTDRNQSCAHIPKNSARPSRDSALRSLLIPFFGRGAFDLCPRIVRLTLRVGLITIRPRMAS